MRLTTTASNIIESLVPIHAPASDSATIPKKRRRSCRGSANIRLCLCMKGDGVRPRRPVFEHGSASTICATIWSPREPLL